MGDIPINKILKGDCLLLLRELPDNSIDCCVTDPPYGWKFMGKKWDCEIPSLEVWQQVLRVVKPGAHILVACGTRTQHRMAVNIEDAGFEIRDVICWHYGQGFPKSLDVSKAIDKSNGKHEVDLSVFGSYVKSKRLAKQMSLSELDAAMGTNTAASWWEGRKDGVQLPGKTTYSLLKKVLEFDDRFDDLINWAASEREVIGKRKAGNSFNWYENMDDRDRGDGIVNITVPATKEAKQYSGWGTALKPATEFWTLARKPISEKNIAANVLKHGAGGLNIDACRIESPDMEAGVPYTVRRLKPGATLNKSGGNWRPDGADSETFTGESKSGRFPANVILDEFMAEEMDRQSGQLTSGARRPEHGIKPKTKNTYGKYAHGGLSSFEGDTGGASRFFYVPKPSAEERGDIKHPTVKPQALIQYLIKLICPIDPARIMLDPFAGSGSHCLAAMKLGVGFIGMELDEKNWQEACNRLEKQMGLFNDPDLYTTGGEY